MIPVPVETHLRKCHPDFQHHLHRTALSAQDLAEVEHVSGYRVAKPVIVRIGSEPTMLVVAAAQRVDLEAVQYATGRDVELVPEWEFSEWFPGCERGAEPPLGLYGLPILVDLALALQDKLVMPAGTHDDAVVVDTSRWMDCEGALAFPGLGVSLH